jgi:hypothetical protein
MKDVKNNLSLNLNIHQEKTAFENLEESIKNSIFSVLYFMLKSQEFSIWIEVIFIIIQLLQFLSFTFNPIVLLFNLVLGSVEKRKSIYSNIKLPSIFPTYCFP